MVAEEIELTDADIIVIIDESEEHVPTLPQYQPDPDYGSDPQWHDTTDGFESSWNEGEITEPLKEVR